MACLFGGFDALSIQLQNFVINFFLDAWMKIPHTYTYTKSIPFFSAGLDCVTALLTFPIKCNCQLSWLEFVCISTCVHDFMIGAKMDVHACSVQFFPV